MAHVRAGKRRRAVGPKSSVATPEPSVAMPAEVVIRTNFLFYGPSLLQTLDSTLARHQAAFNVITIIGAVISLLVMVAAAATMTAAELRTFLPFS